jgi:hypothetical protein
MCRFVYCYILNMVAVSYFETSVSSTVLQNKSLLENLKCLSESLKVLSGANIRRCGSFNRNAVQRKYGQVCARSPEVRLRFLSVLKVRFYRM